MWAATRGALKVVEVLLKNIQDRRLIHAKDKDGNTALALALKTKTSLTAEALLSHGADPNSM
jgi:ankyrin repeat protein